MPDISINGKKYKIVGSGTMSDGDVILRKVQNISDVQEDYYDDIIIKDKSGNLFAISADELDIKGSLLHPYIGLPEVGDQIIYYDDNGEIVAEGEVIDTDPEDDHTTLMNSHEDFTH